MQNMKKTATSIAALFSAVLAIAAPPSVVQRTLQWSEETKVFPYEDSTEPMGFLQFKGAIYRTEQSTLPVYTERFALPAFGEFNVSFGNMVFEPFEKTPSADDAAIAEQINITTAIEKDRADYFGRVDFVPIRWGDSAGRVVS